MRGHRLESAVSGRRRLGAFLTVLLFLAQAATLIGGGLSRGTAGPQAGMKLVAGFNADNVVDVNTDVTPPPNFGGHTMAVAAAPVNGTNPRLMLAATLSGGLWQTTVDATGQSVGRWSHVDSFLPKRLWDVKILANEPNVAIVTATGDTQNGFVTGGVWRGVYSGGSWTWTQATNATASYRMDVVPGPVGASRIYVASFCGLLVSTNSGVGFTGYSPDGNGCNVPHSGQFFDVKVEAIPATSGAPAHDLASVCGVPGFARWSSNTGSGTPGWGVINPNSPIQSGAPLGNGDPRSVNMPCSIALAPFDDNTVFVATQSTQPNGPGGGILFESDTASRANPPAPGFCDPTTCFPQWFNLQPTSDDNGQAAWVVAHPETNPIDPQNFLVYFGTSKRTLVEQCNTQVIFADGMHCSAGSNNWTNFDQNALHSDPSRIFFDDPGDTTYKGCPWIETGDGGIFRDTTVYSSTSNCEDGPAWTDVDSGLRALQSYSLAGSISTSGGTTHTDLYTGRQDNGLLLSLNSGGQWSQSPDTRGGGDEIQILPPYHTTAGVPPGTLYNAGQPFVVKVANEDFSSTTPLTTSPPAPPGYQPATYWNIAQLPPGGGDFLAITPNAAPPGQVWTAYFATLCGFAPGFTCTQWTAAGSNATLPGSPIVAQNPAGIPVYSQVQAAAGFPAGCTSPCHTVDAFYVILKVGSSNHLYRLGNWDLTLTPAQNNPTWTDITGSLKNPGLFAVNPFDPNRLYVLDSGDSMGNHVGFYKTTNGWAAPPAGTTSVDPGWNVDANLNAAIQKFNPVTAQNTYNLGGQSTLIQYDMCSLPGTSVCRNGQTSAILVGNQDAGVFVSLDDGANWRFMRGSDRLADITGAFFDESTEDIFVSSFGRGVFRVDAPPQTSLSIGQPQLPGSPPTVSTTTPLTLTAIGRHPVASINYRIYLAGTTGGLFAPVNASTTTFTLANFADGTYNIDFYGTDVNGNQETVQTAQVVLNGGFASIWTQLNPASSPLARDDAGMAYDPVHNQTVVFGGSNVNGNQMGSTWLWNGTNWTQASPSTSPPARYGIVNAMTWDPVLQKVVLFGGRTSDGAYQNDTWAWDGTTWSQISSSTKPPGREHHSVDFDSNLNALLLFGGSAGGTYYNDTWKLTSTGWSKLSPATSPSARNLTAMVYDSQAGETVLFGGFISSTNAQTNQTWAFRNGTWTQLSPSTLPLARSKHVMTYDSATARVVLFGGWDNVTSQPLGDLWTFDGSNWKQQTPSPMPSARYEPSLAYGQGNAIVLFGGATSTTSKLNDTWTLAP